MPAVNYMINKRVNIDDPSHMQKYDSLEEALEQFNHHILTHDHVVLRRFNTQIWGGERLTTIKELNRPALEALKQLCIELDNA